MTRLAHFESEMKYEVAYSVQHATLLSPKCRGSTTAFFLSYELHIQESNLGQPETIAKPDSMEPKPFTSCHYSLESLSMFSGIEPTIAIYKSKVVFR